MDSGGSYKLIKESFHRDNSLIDAEAVVVAAAVIAAVAAIETAGSPHPM
jgi:hypothetical protein